jgi:hypothetical protein
MKIHQLPLGARFEYAGEEYVKTGPLVASGKGGQRLIPKYAVLRVLGEGASATPAPPRSLDRQAVQAAGERFHARCAALVPVEKRAELDAASADFLRDIDQVTPAPSA